MIVELTFDNGKHIATYSLPSDLRRKYKAFLMSEFIRRKENKQPDKYPLLFAGGEWSIPKEFVNEMYAKIVRGYSDLDIRKYHEKKIISKLVVTKQKIREVTKE